MRLLIGDFFSATRIVPRKLQVAKAPYAYNDGDVLLKRAKEEAISFAAEATDA